MPMRFLGFVDSDDAANGRHVYKFCLAEHVILNLSRACHGELVVSLSGGNCAVAVAIDGLGENVEVECCPSALPWESGLHAPSGSTDLTGAGPTLTLWVSRIVPGAAARQFADKGRYGNRYACSNHAALGFVGRAASASGYRAAVMALVSAAGFALTPHGRRQQIR